jgi:general L-amino acid transport system ATP-binding protein
MVFQHFNLFPHLTILENLTLAPIWVRKTPKKQAGRAGHALPEAGEDPRTGEQISRQLSGGSSSAWPIARALCMNPRIMLFDEPTSASIRR